MRRGVAARGEGRALYFYGSAGAPIGLPNTVGQLGLTQATRPPNTTYCSRDGSGDGPSNCGSGTDPVGSPVTFACASLKWPQGAGRIWP